MERERKKEEKRKRKIEDQYNKKIKKTQLLMNEKQWSKAIEIWKEIENISEQLGNQSYRENASKQRIFCETKHEFKVINYHGTPIIGRDYDVLMEIDKITGKIPIISEHDYYTFGFNTFGFKVQDDVIVGLGLYEKGLTSLPDTIENLKSLKKLNLSYNKLTSLPDTIKNLNSLKELILSSNQLTSLPESIGNLKSLQTIGLSNNKLTTLPESIGNLKSLQTLGLSNNWLTTLPDTLGNLESLKELDLRWNRLSSLSGILKKWLENLKKNRCVINAFKKTQYSKGRNNKYYLRND